MSWWLTGQSGSQLCPRWSSVVPGSGRAFEPGCAPSSALERGSFEQGGGCLSHLGLCGCLLVLQKGCLFPIHRLGTSSVEGTPVALSGFVVVSLLLQRQYRWGSSWEKLDIFYLPS